VHPPHTSASRRSFRDRGANGVRRRGLRGIAIAGVAASALLAALSLGAQGAAAAPEEIQASAATITAPTAGQFLGNNSFTVTGTADAGSTVVVTAPGGADCTVAPTTASPWSCVLDHVPNGSGIVLTATETKADATTSSASVTVNVLGAPTLDGPGSFVTPGIVSGGALTGATVSVMVNGSGGQGCTSVAVNSYWSCSISAPTGGPYTVTAHQSMHGIGGPSDESNSQKVTVDKDRPAAPVVTSPRTNSRVVTEPVTFSGTGEPNGFLNVYVDASPVCGASVSSAGRWSCAASGIKHGVHAVQAIQSDLAGNFSDPSAPSRVYFGPRPASAVPPAPPPPSTESPTPSPEPSASPDPPAPYVPGSGEPPPSLHESLTNWGTPTTFGTNLPTLAETISQGNWLFAPLLALGFILLVALPLRLVASTLRGRIRLPRTQFTGRNRSLPEPDDTPPPNPWLVGAIPLAIAAGFAVVAVGYNGEVRFLRLLAAVGIGLAVLNVVGVAIATRAASKLQGVSGRLRFLPLLLLAAGLAAVLSRWTGIEPPVLAGVLIGVGFGRMTASRPRAIVSLVEVGTIVILAVAAWLAFQWIGPVQGFWATLSTEVLATICLAGLGSAVILMLPLGRLPGRVVAEWSPPAWLVAMAIVATLAWVIVLGGSDARFPVMGSAMVAGGFAAVSLAVWAWTRYVETAEV
jgi:hypothetical protein